MLIARCKCPSGPRFFGLNPEYREVILEQAFLLGMKMRMPYETVMRMPVRFRRWFIDRLVKYYEKQPESPMEDMDTPIVPSKMRNN